MKFRTAIFLIVGFISVSVCADESGDDITILDDVAVTATREKGRISETPQSISVVSESVINDLHPHHGSDLLNSVPGAHTTGMNSGEGGQVAMRQPITTNPAYIFAENGIPIRSPGFYNHNGFFDTDMASAGSIEISKGPGSALYGSDAVGGIFNVITRSAPSKTELETKAEFGSFDYNRQLLRAGTGSDNYGVSLDLNHTQGAAFRDGIGYDKKSGLFQLDNFIGRTSIKTLVGFSHVEEQPGGALRLRQIDYLNNPQLNYFPIGFRNMDAFRASSAVTHEFDDKRALTVTPYFRDNTSTMMQPSATWSLDPRYQSFGAKSVGAQTKYRQDFDALRARTIVGLDVEGTNGNRIEHDVLAQGRTLTSSGAKQYYAYTLGQKIYDYNVDYQSISPFTHLELSPIDSLRITGGLRYDIISFDYKNNMSTLLTGSRKRPESTELVFQHLSPKIGATYAIDDSTNVFVNYSEGLRTPSESQMFRPGSSINTTSLSPTVVKSKEIGLRGSSFLLANYSISFYDMGKVNDVLTYTDPTTGFKVATNNGSTVHRGIEIGGETKKWHDLSLGLAASYAEHKYRSWKPDGTTNYSGNFIEAAPKTMTTTSLHYSPNVLNGGKVALDWVHLSDYFLTAQNAQKYGGHDVLNLYSNYNVNKQLELSFGINNLADRRYAEWGTWSAADGYFLAPAAPRSFFGGISYKWL